MPKPTDLPVAATDVNYPMDAEPEEGTPTKVEPASGKQELGYRPGEKPAAQTLNWWMNLVYLWILFLDGIFGPNDEISVGSITTTGTIGHLDADDNRRQVSDDFGLRAGRVSEYLIDWQSSTTGQVPTTTSVAQTGTVDREYETPLGGRGLKLYVVDSNDAANAYVTGYLFDTPIKADTMHVLECEVSIADLVGTPQLYLHVGFDHDITDFAVGKVLFRKSNETANWQIYHHGGAGTIFDTAVVATAGKTRLRMVWLGADYPGVETRVLCYINGVLAHTVTTDMPNGDPQRVVATLSSGGPTGTAYVSAANYRMARVLSDDTL